jgi:hypothetical protein
VIEHRLNSTPKCFVQYQTKQDCERGFLPYLFCSSYFRVAIEALNGTLMQESTRPLRIQYADALYFDRTHEFNEAPEEETISSIPSSSASSDITSMRPPVLYALTIRDLTIDVTVLHLYNIFTQYGVVSDVSISLNGNPSGHHIDAVVQIFGPPELQNVAIDHLSKWCQGELEPQP